MRASPAAVCAALFGFALAAAPDAAAAPPDEAPGGSPSGARVGPSKNGSDVDALCTRMFASVGDAQIEFHRSSSILRSSSYAALDRLVSFIRDCPRGVIRITGRAGTQGDADDDRVLGRKRSAAVAAYLKSAGVPAARLELAETDLSEGSAGQAAARTRARKRTIGFELVVNRR